MMARDVMGFYLARPAGSMRGAAPIVVRVKMRRGRRWRTGGPSRRAPAPAPVPALVLLPAFRAPVVLVAGWSLPSGAQPDGFSNVQQSLSFLAADGTPHREV